MPNWYRLHNTVQNLVTWRNDWVGLAPASYKAIPNKPNTKVIRMWDTELAKDIMVVGIPPAAPPAIPIAIAIQSGTKTFPLKQDTAFLPVYAADNGYGSARPGPQEIDRPKMHRSNSPHLTRWARFTDKGKVKPKHGSNFEDHSEGVLRKLKP